MRSKPHPNQPMPVHLKGESPLIKKAWMLNALLFTIVSLGCLSIGELILRTFWPILPSVYQPDDVLLHKFVPNSKEITHSKENGKKISVNINSLGFRGEDFALATTKKRIVVYGDSFIEGEFTPLENTFVKQLEKRLLAQRENVEVINAGIVGYGPDQVSLKMEQELPILKPDLVIVGIFAGNDFGDLLRDKIYKLDAHNQLQQNSYFLDSTLRSALNASAFPKKLDRFQILLRVKALRQFFRLKTLRKFFSEMKRIFRPQRFYAEQQIYFHQLIDRDFKECVREYTTYILENDNCVRNLIFDHYETDIALTPDTPSSRYKIKLMEEVILKIRETTQSKGVPMVLLIIPAAGDSTDRFECRIDQNEHPQYKRSRLTDILETIAVKHGIKFLNLFPVFKEDGANHFFLGFPDGHWNDAGQRLAAELMARLIQEEQVL
jgi:acetyltransferase AlgX (SGNH hydrolase-like protein)